MAKEEKGPDFAKYKAITNILVKDAPKALGELERKLLFTFVDHVRANPKKEGAGLGGKIYDTVRDYVRGEFCPKASDANGEAILNHWVQGMFGEISRDGLESQLEDVKEVPVGLVHELYNKIAEGVKEGVSGLVQMRVNDLTEADQEPFKAYVLSLAKKMGLEHPNKDDLQRPFQVKGAYLKDILPAYMKWLAQKAQVEAEAHQRAQKYGVKK